jgi:hypothetical protein
MMMTILRMLIYDDEVQVDDDMSTIKMMFSMRMYSV